MLVKPERITQSDPALTTILVVVAVLVAVGAFSGGLWELVNRWSHQEEYNHGFFIPLIVIWMLWARRDALVANLGPPSWIGPIVVFLTIPILVVGELSALFLLSQLGFIVALIGIVLAIGGFALLRVTFLPIAFLAFAIPLPYFIDAELSFRLQLISSQLGVLFIRSFGVPVYLTGNVIDLGNYKLQVVDACSGLRYLYPLFSLGFLAAYLFQGRLWQRAIVCLSTIPITIVMNSLRIAMIAVTFEYWGIQMADGFLHFFEGWIIFVACAGLLTVEIYLFARLALHKSFFQVFYLPQVVGNIPSISGRRLVNRFPALSCVLLLCVAGLSVFMISTRQEIRPDRLRFVAFPSELGSWQGHPSLLEADVEQALDLDDYILSDYRNSGGGVVNLYVAYYASQRKGSSPHSPIVCIPGGGWQILNFDRTSYRGDGQVALPLNRVIIARGSNRQLVYYWFVERGRNIANEYWSKWFLFVDSIMMNRTDGALVRLTTPLYPGQTEQAADDRLHAFIKDLEPRLGAYLPSQTSVDKKTVAHQTPTRQL